MKGKIFDLEGNEKGQLELPVEDLLANLSLTGSSDATLAEKDSRITELEGQVAELSSENHDQQVVAKALEQFKANPALYVEVGRQMGLNVQAVEEAAEVADKPKVEYDTMVGKGPAEDGWEYNPLFNLSTRPKTVEEK